MARGGRWRIGMGLVALSLLVAGCDNPPPRQEKKLPIPKGESTLDDLIKKSQAKPAPSLSPARLSVEPVTVDFGVVTLGESAARQVRLINSGESPASLVQIHLAGQPQAFSVTGTCVAGLELNPGNACTLTVIYRPRREGETEAEVVIGHSATGGSLFVSLSGQAQPRQAAVAAVTAAVVNAPNAEASLLFARSRQDGGLSVETGGGAIPTRRTPVDNDYTEAGLPGIVSTFPVDRTRVITADRYIPAVLENTIGSQLPGRAIAVVERNVFGSQGRSVLIPAGSRVVGHYRSLARYGEARLDISWSRIIRPDGVSINIDNQAADVMGRTGLPGDLDTRFFEKYGSSLLTSVIAAAGDWALSGSSTSVTSPLGGTTQSLSGRARAGNRLGNDLDQLGQRMIQENVDIRPVLTVPQGTRLNIIPSEDIWLRDPDRLQAVSAAKGNLAKVAASNTDLATQLLPGLVEAAAQNPGLQKLAPQTAQQIMQSGVLQQLRESGTAASANAAGSTASTGSASSAVRP
ncbi:TrbI/VirB10 family protein [Telmatospirillum siberiense]|uniref:Abnormal spindle-like microcephaly-associated protein ASH domain-containing protein n=1 Tax=Telmatospirillum siberiense TaxID=382514 RepID=A0A2N3Q1E2_9PROT|nr:TrbI/VirB10 family protein [Telmatospirillum siberiense]PKU26478.1 hypothetical protein CWS72_01130 [Telmatospirillum siberiense]